MGHSVNSRPATTITVLFGLGMEPHARTDVIYLWWLWQWWWCWRWWYHQLQWQQLIMMHMLYPPIVIPMAIATHLICMNDPSTWLQFKTFTHTDFWMQTACIQKGTLWWFFLHGTFLVWNYVGTKWKFFMLFYANTYSFLVFLPKLEGSTNLLLLVLDHVF